MAKIKIHLNGTDYNIDKSALADVINNLKTHFSTTMAGTGAAIEFDGATYNIDFTKLSTATNNFVAHLGTIAGSGEKVVVNGIEYGIDSTKLTDAISDIEAALSDASEERLEGDGAEYYTLAPTALSFRSTAPLNELQEVQINGVTVDPSNYTLEEGSTIVTFPIEYLKTLNVGSYEVAVVSDSKNVKGGFTVAAPELNQHGFYYNQPYSANLPMFGGDTAFFVREDGTYDIITVGKYPETGEYTMDGNNIVATHPQLGTITCTISSNGAEIFCNELQVAFKLSNSTAITADEDYIYTYKEDLGGYEVQCIDKTKAEYGDIKTGINGIDTVKLADYMFALGTDDYEFNVSLTSIPNIPNTVAIIGYAAFAGCQGVKTLTIPSSIQIIEENAFVLTYFKEVYIVDANNWLQISFGNAASYPSGTIVHILDTGGSEITALTLSNKITSIGDSAFENCTSLTSITIPNSVTSIGDSAFENCTSLTSITIPNSVTSIGERAFEDCTSLASVYITDVAAWCNITFGSDDANPLYHARNLYLNNTLVTDLVIPASVTSIGEWAFYNCTSLASIEIPASVTSIGNWAFSSIYDTPMKLASVTFAENSQLTSIGNWAFDNCTSLTSIEIPASVTSIGDGVFSGCTSLASIMVEQGNTVYHSAGNCLIETASKTLIAGCQNSVIPADGSVTSIGKWAFDNCTSLASINIPESVTSIGNWAFYNCTSLASVTIPISVTSIGYQAFGSCYSLASVTFEGTVDQFRIISKGNPWISYVSATHVQCSDGQVAL